MLLSTWRELALMSDEELRGVDIAFVNLACAAGLPGAPDETRLTKCIERLNYFARAVDVYTKQCLPEFLANPGNYRDSEAYFRMLALVTLVSKHHGVRYNSAKIPQDVPLDTTDSFIHGALFGDGGTCASLPVVFTAVGRRLGYPLKLVSTRSGDIGHLFARWDRRKWRTVKRGRESDGIGLPPRRLLSDRQV
jgi:hypothetical protein